MSMYCINETCYALSQIQIVQDYGDGLINGLVIGVLAIFVILILIKYSMDSVYREAIEHPEEFEVKKKKYQNRKLWG